MPLPLVRKFSDTLDSHKLSHLSLILMIDYQDQHHFIHTHARTIKKVNSTNPKKHQSLNKNKQENKQRKEPKGSYQFQ